MSIRIRCEKCGQLVIALDKPGRKVRCPCCRSKIRIPRLLASLPRPRLPRGPTEPASRGDQVAFSEDHRAAQHDVVARIMPWILSLMLHAALALALALVVMLTVAKERTKGVAMTVWPWSKPGGPMTSTVRLDNRPLRQPRPTRERGTSVERGRVIVRIADRKIDLVGRTTRKPGLDGGKLAPLGTGRGIFTDGDPRGEKPARHVVFVIDRSGSMVDTFREVCAQICISVGFMRKDQSFHVILFSDGPPLENGPRRLVPATVQRKVALAEYLEYIRASGQTDPAPALKRAFQLLGDVDRGRDNKLVHLLTDGVFPDNEKVLAMVRRMNPDRKVRINTYLYGHRPPVADMVMKKIAFESGGRYKYIRPGQ